MHNVYFDTASLTVALLASIFWTWSGMEGVVWPAFELHDEQLQLASSGNQFQKSATFKPIALLPASH